MVCLHLRAIFKLSKDMSGFHEKFFSAFSDICATLSCFIFTVWIIYIPMYGDRQIKKNFGTLDVEIVRESIGVFYQDLKIDNLEAARYNILFMTRRIVTSFVIVFMDFQPYFQAVILFVMATYEHIIVFTVKPFEDDWTNMTTLVDESIVMLYCYCLILLTN